MTIVVLGGGAAGFFAAITCAENHPEKQVLLLEKTNTLLAKVRISGGGRCNVTHACFDPNLLVKNYPRGNKALIGPFHRFQPKDIIQWFESRGVDLKVEEDGRMFPTTDSSQTIIDCFLSEAKRLHVDIRLRQHIERIEKIEDKFCIHLVSHAPIKCERLIIATGSGKDGYAFAQSFGHTIVPPVPSLFSFNIPNFNLEELSGISVPLAQVKIEGSNLQQEGPMLITHWGFSGPAILKLSAWAARHLHDVNYEGSIIVNWLPNYTHQTLLTEFQRMKQQTASRSIVNENPFGFAKQLWKAFLEMAGLAPQQRVGDIPNKQWLQLADILQRNTYPIKGKTTYKQEFVTSGGVDLDEVNFKTMQSRLCPGLHFAGEILNIDGVTGGFNFQNAWTTGWLASQ